MFKNKKETQMKEAAFYKLIDPVKSTVRCSLCAHVCTIKDNKFGLCKVRQNIGGTLFSLVYGRLVSNNIDPIEKKPIFHLLPGSKSYSIATVGCNFSCKHCQNYQISQYPKLNKGDIPGSHTTPEDVVSAAKKSSCKSISYTYVEPTIFFEFAYDTALLAHEEGIKNIFVSNGYTGPKAAQKIAPYLDANNIDLKSFSDSFYRNICGAKLAPVLDTIILMKELGVWVEVTTLIIPGLNDTNSELKNIARFLVGIDPDIPWHVSRFHPTYKISDRPPTPHERLHTTRQIGLDAGLKYIYTGNIPGQGGENTICPSCGKIVIERIGYTIIGHDLCGNKCSFCKTTIAGIF